MEDAKNKVNKNIQLVIFELDKEEYALDIIDLQEIIKMPDITPIPNAPDFITGIFNLRGKIVVVVDLEKRFSLKRDYPKNYEGNIIITEISENNYGIIVDKVTEIINVPRTCIQPTPELITAKIHADYLKGVVVLEDNEVVDSEEEKSSKDKKKKTSGTESRLIILLDLHKMLQEKELLSVGKIAQEAKQKN